MLKSLQELVRESVDKEKMIKPDIFDPSVLLGNSYRGATSQ